MLDVQGDLRDCSGFIARLDDMPTSTRRFGHFQLDSMFTVAGEAVDYSADDEMGPKIFGQTIKFVDVALPVADMHASPRISDKFRWIAANCRASEYSPLLLSERASD